MEAAAGMTVALAEDEATATAMSAELEATDEEATGMTDETDETEAVAETAEEALALTAAPLRSLPVPQGMASPLG